MSAQDIVLVILGIAACFAGYSMFQTILPMWGFLLGGWITLTLLPTFVQGAQAETLLYQVGAFVIGGLIGALISTPLYFVIIFLSGGALGMMLGIVVGALIDTGGITSVSQLNAFANLSFPPMPQSGLQLLLMVVFGLILGIFAIGFQKFTICASSSFLGAGAVITGLSGPITSAANDTSRGVLLMMGWFILALIGLFLQLRMMSD